MEETWEVVNVDGKQQVQVSRTERLYMRSSDLLQRKEVVESQIGHYEAELARLRQELSVLQAQIAALQKSQQPEEVGKP